MNSIQWNIYLMYKVVPYTCYQNKLVSNKNVWIKKISLIFNHMIMNFCSKYINEKLESSISGWHIWKEWLRQKIAILFEGYLKDVLQTYLAIFYVMFMRYQLTMSESCECCPDNLRRNVSLFPHIFAFKRRRKWTCSQMQFSLQFKLQI